MSRAVVNTTVPGHDAPEKGIVMGNGSVTSGGKLRGLAAVSAERRREIASIGGRAAHACGRAHKFSPAQAQEAGRRGGATVAADRRHMAEIGRAGGRAAARNRAALARAAASVGMGGAVTPPAAAPSAPQYPEPPEIPDSFYETDR